MSIFIYGEFRYQLLDGFSCSIGDSSGKSGNGCFEYTNFTGTAIIPSNIQYEGKQYSVTRTSKRAFYECSKLTKIILPQSLNFISRDSFSFSAITELIVPSSVVELEGGAFYAMRSVTKIIFQPGSQLKKINNAAFASMGANNIVLPSSIESIIGPIFKYNYQNSFSFYLCSKNNFSSVSFPFEEGLSNGKIYVVPEYQGETFGGHPIVRMENDSICIPYKNEYKLIGPRNHIMNSNIIFYTVYIWNHEFKYYSLYCNDFNLKNNK